MAVDGLLTIADEVTEALQTGKPVVALESTLIAHGLPWPINQETALEAEAAVRQSGAIPATIAIWRGRPIIGLSQKQIMELAEARDVAKASRRDLALAVVRGQTAATTVAATMFLAYQAGIRLFATGGIGGVHPGDAWDVSADLVELGRIPVAVVSAGAKIILDIPRTLEVLETLGVPVLGYQTSEFPAFYVRSSGCTVPARVETASDAAAFLDQHWRLGGAGVLIAQPIPYENELDGRLMKDAIARAHDRAEKEGIAGPRLTPFLLAELARATEGKTIAANKALVIANARLAGQIALHYSGKAAGSN